jgi:hypothetical protein
MNKRFTYTLLFIFFLAIILLISWRLATFIFPLNEASETIEFQFNNSTL